MINLSQPKIDWKRTAVVQRRTGPIERLLVDELQYDGTVEGATKYFKSRSQAEQDQIEVFVDGRVIEGVDEDTILGSEELRTLGSRPDLPQ
jgi:hypothetical protein